MRKRPLLRREQTLNDSDILEVQPPAGLLVREPRVKFDMTRYVEEHVFAFDAVFDEHCDNVQLYNALLRSLVASAFGGAKLNVFAYGQTGSGKTFTMMGSEERGVPGLYLLAAEDVFRMLGRMADVCLAVSFYEIYCGKVHDLLAGREPCFVRVDARENVHVVGLSEKIVASLERLMLLIRVGLAARVTGCTGVNDQSSRSHAVLALTLRNALSGKAQGRLSFIDLAGSERGADVTDTSRQTRVDGAEINKSLLALKECIRAMDQDRKYLPFRGSKLTMVLKDSFVGNSVTVMIGNVAPTLTACEHTLNTLRYADRVKQLRREQEPDDARDQLARQLTLPRRQGNSAKVSLPAQAAEPQRSLSRPRRTEPPQPCRASLCRPRSREHSARRHTIAAPASQPALQRLLAQQDELVGEHSAHIDTLVASVKEEMGFLEELRDSPADIRDYIAKTKALLARKMEAVLVFRQKLLRFEEQFEGFDEGAESSGEELFPLRAGSGSVNELLD